MLLKTLGPDHTRRILGKGHAVAAYRRPASRRSSGSIPQQLSRFFLGEHPQTTALILAHLHPSSAAELLEQLPNDMRTEVLLRLANLGENPPDVVARVSERH
jgi:flagellar motor switch protein FliG